MAAAPVFEFDRFELDIGGYELRRAGRKVRLQRVPMDLLILLIERRGALVTREEIVARVWNGDGFVDTQSSINTAIRKIRQALDDDGEQPRFVETVIGKGYRFIGDVAARVLPQEAAVSAPVAAQAPIVPAKPRYALLTLIAAAAAVVIGAMVLFFLRRTPQNREPMTIVPFTAVPGPQSWPAFSPDGNRVAFGWTGGTGTCSHIYVKTVGAASQVELTHSGECDSSPSWSRNGRWIAFLRSQPASGLGLYVIAAVGGTARKIADVNGPVDYRPAWTPDGKGLVVMDSEPPEVPPSLFRVAIDSGDKRRVTTADLSGTGDWCPAYSPNGRMLAYLHNTGSIRLSPLEVEHVDAHGMPSVLPKMIETGSFGFTSFDWSADGRFLIATDPSGLVRVALSGGSAEPLPFPSGSEPAVAPHGSRMVYVRPYRDTDIFRVPGPRGSGSVSRLISSTRAESAPQYSADGRRIAFVSDRTGSEEIWVADSDGQNVRQVTSFEGPGVGSPRWSPDGKWIAFDSTASGNAGIYIVAPNGGQVRKITLADVSCVRPSWSHNGRWIYFGSNQSGDWQIWKTMPQGGPPVQVTRNGGREAFEDPNGEFVYYTKTPTAKGIWRVPPSGGDEVEIASAGRQGRWAVGGSGIYYLSAPGELVFQEFSSKRCIRVPTSDLQLGAANMIGAAPDDRSILLTVLVRSEDRLVLVRNFQ
ncbi:MAG TPA: winged helix-turn-helix domain-containing protein [Bryobacteraceae bacterium]